MGAWNWYSNPMVLGWLYYFCSDFHILKFLLYQPGVDSNKYKIQFFRTVLGCQYTMHGTDSMGIAYTHITYQCNNVFELFKPKMIFMYIYCTAYTYLIYDMSRVHHEHHKNHGVCTTDPTVVRLPWLPAPQLLNLKNWFHRSSCQPWQWLKPGVHVFASLWP